MLRAVAPGWRTLLGRVGATAVLVGIALWLAAFTLLFFNPGIVAPPNSLQSADVTQVTSAYNGRVIELRAERGSIVSPSDTLLSLESSDLPLEAIVYLPTSASANVRPGMPVQILPDNVAREEYGFLRG